jgi:glycosyl hydrolase family 44
MKHSYNIQALRQTKLCCCLLVLVSFILTNCSGAVPGEPVNEATVRFPTPTTAPVLAQPVSPVPVSVAPPASPSPAVSSPVATQGTVIRVDASQNVHPISPLIYGMNQAPKEQQQALGITLNRWGGNPSTRYNWKLGNAWNAGSDYFYRNGDYGYTGSSASDDFVAETLAAGGAVLVTLPTLGWVVKNNDASTCSFPTPDGQCGDAEKASCDAPGAIADPNRANIPSDASSVIGWVKHLLVEKKYAVRFFAMDNEPDIWGATHYDVHPNCTTYDEIRDKYIEYASAVRAVAPQAELLGPVSCCWHFYWNSAAGAGDKAKHDGQDFLPWFLDEVRRHDQQASARTLDVLDVHYYPEGLYNDNVDPATAAHRLRSTRSLWDKTYVDESWIGEPVNLISRMKQLLAEHYPGTKLGISEWNWGADKTINGALAIADVLGVFGREDVYLAGYWRYPELGSPGFYAFKLFMNYDDRGGHFGDTSIQALSSAPDQISAYAGLNNANDRLTLMLVNKDPNNDMAVNLDIKNFSQNGTLTLYRYSAANSGGIVSTPLTLDQQSAVTLPAYSISLLVIEAH